MTKRSLGLALLLGLPVVAGGAYAVHSFTSKSPSPAAVAEQARPDADVPDQDRHAHGKKKHKGHHARAQRAERAGAGQARSQTVDGAFQRWLVSPRGEALGMMLADGTIVKLPHGAVASPGLKAGDALHVEGRAHQIDQSKVMVHASVSKEGKVLFENAPKAKGDRAEREPGQKLQPMTATGKVIALIPARKGALLGVVLDDGTTVVFGHAGSDVSLKIGDAVTVEGKGGTYPIGTGIAAQSIKLPSGETKTFGRNGNKNDKGN